MYKLRIMPLKVYNSIFLTLLFCDFVFWIGFLKISISFATNFFLIGLIPVVATFIPYFIFNGIKVSEEEIIIKEFGFKGYKRFKFPIKNIVRLEIKKGKSYFGQRRNYFVIHSNENDENKLFVINEERYLIKHLKSLFNNIHESFIIPCDKN